MIAPSTPVRHQSLEHLQVRQLGDAARGHDRPVGRGADVAQQVDVGPLQHAVLVDVGHDVAGAALGVEPGQHLVEVAALAGPAAGRQRPAAYVEPDGDPVAVLRDGGRTPLRLLEGSGADVDPPAAASPSRPRGTRRRGSRRSSRRRCRGCRRSSPGGRGCGRDRTPRRGRRGGSTPRPPPASAAQPRRGRRTASPTRPRPGPAGRPGRRRCRRRGGARDVSWSLPDQRVWTQLRSSWAPASPDFSGWNWVALRGPFSTAATNRSPPCSVQVTSGARVRSLVCSVQSRTP